MAKQNSKKELIAVYSITNKDVSLYNEAGLCICTIPCANINAIMQEYSIKDSNLHVTL